jgi:Tfp pilus assembly protein FimT
MNDSARKRLRATGQAGLTAVELVVVLVLITMLALAVYPSLSNFLQVMQSKGAAEQMGSAARQARHYAITNGQNYCIKFEFAVDTADGLSKPRYRVGPTADTTATSCTLSSTTLSEWIGASASFSPSPTSIVFDPIGNVLNQGMTTPYVLQLVVDTQPASCATTVGVTRYGGIRVIQC